jgi:serine/threonine-protein kinase RsbW
MHCVEVSIPSNLIFERVVRATAAEIAEAFEFPEDRVEDLKLAISEAVTNAIEHGNERIATKPVAVVFEMDNHKLEIRVSDEGKGTEKVDSSRRVVEEEALDDVEAAIIRGFGMYLIGALVDDWEVVSTNNGTVITLRFYREGQQE